MLNAHPRLTRFHSSFTAADNHNLNYRTRMLQSWNKFNFTSGDIKVSVGPDENMQGYVRFVSIFCVFSFFADISVSSTVACVWTMGNLARPGYPETTDRMSPYTYAPLRRSQVSLANILSGPQVRLLRGRHLLQPDLTRTTWDHPPHCTRTRQDQNTIMN